MAKKKKTTALPPQTQMNPTMPVMSTGSMGMTSGGEMYAAAPPTMMLPPQTQQSLPGKKQKDKKNKKNKPTLNMTPEQMAALNLSPEQMAQMQLEEAVKEGQNPSMRLKKLKSPISVGSCFLNLFFLFVISLVMVFVFAAVLYVDKFDLGVLFKDMFDDFGITRFFQSIGEWFSNIGK